MSCPARTARPPTRGGSSNLKSYSLVSSSPASYWRLNSSPSGGIRASEMIINPPASAKGLIIVWVRGLSTTPHGEEISQKFFTALSFSYEFCYDAAANDLDPVVIGFIPKIYCIQQFNLPGIARCLKLKPRKKYISSLTEVVR